MLAEDRKLGVGRSSRAECPEMSALPAEMSQRRVDDAGYLAVAGGALIVLGRVLPWVTMRNDDFSIQTESGMVGGDGPFFLIVGIFVAALGSWVVRDHHPGVAPALFLLAGVAVIGVCALEYFSDIKQRVEDTSGGLSTASVGTGIFIMFGGGLATALAGGMLAGAIGRARGNVVLASLACLAVVAVLTIVVFILFFAPGPGGPATT
jgi:hypothetical protein